MKNDPIVHIEQMIKDLHDSAGKFTKPVLLRYPLLFLFLLAFSVSAIMHGFSAIMDEVTYFSEHPFILMSAGVVVLLLTGKLYKSLGGKSH